MDSLNKSNDEGNIIQVNENDYASEAMILNSIINQLQKINDDARIRILKTISTFFNLEKNIPTKEGIISSLQGSSSFSEDRNISAKDFLMQKSPQTDIERVACLAYYLTHYRNVPNYKALDLSTLNMEAAQLKFANIHRSVDNATRQAGFLAQSAQGNKQISALGELYVQALPDREAAKNIIANYRRRKRNKRISNENTSS